MLQYEICLSMKKIIVMCTRYHYKLINWSYICWMIFQLFTKYLKLVLTWDNNFITGSSKIILVSKRTAGLDLPLVSVLAKTNSHMLFLQKRCYDVPPVKPYHFLAGEGHNWDLYLGYVSLVGPVHIRQVTQRDNLVRLSGSLWQAGHRHLWVLPEREKKMCLSKSENKDIHLYLM